jgi:hypothetical protein
MLADALLAAAQTIVGKAGFRRAYCRNKFMSVASCIHPSMADDGKSANQFLNQSPVTLSTTDEHGFTRMGKRGARHLTRIARIVAN